MNFDLKMVLISCVAIASFWVAIYFLSWVVQLIWAWVDDAKIGKKNWLAKQVKFSFTKWKYPVFNGSYQKGKDIFGWAKDPSLKNASIYNLREGYDYIYDWSFRGPNGSFFRLGAFVSVMPLIVFTFYKQYQLMITISSIIILAHLGRFARRVNKKLMKHVADKNAHSEKEERANGPKD
jgi:putative effector of murein hydrolase LrgA (UPF0299 family)